LPLRYKLTVSYDGTNYHGFQSQINGNSIEAELNKALTKLIHKPVKVVGSGRTDKGVHAKGQVVHFDSPLNIPAYNYLSAINSFLPNDIKAVEIEKVDKDFHARHSAVKKTYQYVIGREYNLFNRNHEAYIKYPLDIDLMNQATKKFIGTHDFKGFSGYVKDKPTIKEIYEATLEVKEDQIYLTFTGNGFLKYMVRRMVGTIIEIGLKRIALDVIDEIFSTQNSSLCGKTASPEGLYLIKVYY